MLDTKHPTFAGRAEQWQTLLDCYRGEDAIKSAGIKYLPPTEGMVLDGMMGVADKGYQRYVSYKDRAVFPDFVKQGIVSMVGIMHQEPARIEVPDAMKPLLERMTLDGESAQTLLRRFNERQLLNGRIGALVEVPNNAGPTALPYVVTYEAPAITNWDSGDRAAGQQGMEFIILDESGMRRQSNFEWKEVRQYRVLAMSKTVATVDSSTQVEDDAVGVYQVNVPAEESLQIDAGGWKAPSLAGRTLTEIPFVFVGTKDLSSEPDDPPLYGLAKVCLAIYRGEADYRHSLYMQGQDTLVISGADDESKSYRIGGGATLTLPQNSKAEFIGTSSLGLTAMRTAIQDDRTTAGEVTTRLLDTAGGTTYQSGEALRIRIAAKTATLREIAHTGAEALKRILQIMARWMNEDETKIVVEPNMNFSDSSTSSKTVLELQQAKSMGAPLSQKTIHRYMARNDLTQMTFEEEQAEIKKEPPPIPPRPGVSGGGAGGLGSSTGGNPVKRGVPAAQG